MVAQRRSAAHRCPRHARRDHRGAGALAPALAMAARTVGSPQIRNRGQSAATSDVFSAGDALPPLLALQSARSPRSQVRARYLDTFFTGVKDNAHGEGRDHHRSDRNGGRRTSTVHKIGTRNAMAIAVVSCALVLRTGARSVRTGLGSVATPRRSPEAERFLEAELEAGSYWERPTHCAVDRRSLRSAGRARGQAYR